MFRQLWTGVVQCGSRHSLLSLCSTRAASDQTILHYPIDTCTNKDKVASAHDTDLTADRFAQGLRRGLLLMRRKLSHNCFLDSISNLLQSSICNSLICTLLSLNEAGDD